MHNHKGIIQPPGKNLLLGWKISQNSTGSKINSIKLQFNLTTTTTTTKCKLLERMWTASTSEQNYMISIEKY